MCSLLLVAAEFLNLFFASVDLFAETVLIKLDVIRFIYFIFMIYFEQFRCATGDAICGGV